MKLLQQIDTAVRTAMSLLKNKLWAFLVLFVLMQVYHALPERSAFAEMLYVLLLVNLIMLVAPIMRLLVFNEASQYAEAGGLDEDMEEGFLSARYYHYRFATALCYACTTVCVGALAFL